MDGELYPGEFEAMEHNGRMDAVMGGARKGAGMTREEAIETLEQMIEWGDSYEVDYDACEIAIEALKQEPKLRQALEQEKGAYNALAKSVQCEDSISRQAALDAIYARYIGGKEAVENADYSDQYAEGISEAAEAIEDLPSVHAEPRTGHWIQAKRPFNFRFKCSECGRPALKNERNGNDVKSKYCPRCGAKMESGKDN